MPVDKNPAMAEVLQAIADGNYTVATLTAPIDKTPKTVH